MNWLAVGAGAALGAWLRWGLGLWLNGLHARLPFGTLLVNLAGGYLIGAALGFFQAYPSMPAESRLLVITGFLGGLTTFSTFSAEAMVLLQDGEFLWAAIHIGAHVIGSIVCCIAGYASVRALLA